MVASTKKKSRNITWHNITWCWRLVASLLLRRPNFDPGPIHVGFLGGQCDTHVGFPPSTPVPPVSTLRLKCDGTRAETRFRLSAKRTSPFKSAGGRQFSRLLAAEVCPSAVVMLDTPCSEVVWRVLATHSIRQFPLHFPSRASPCAITFQLDSNIPPSPHTLPPITDAF